MEMNRFAVGYVSHFPIVVNSDKYLIVNPHSYKVVEFIVAFNRPTCPCVINMYHEIIYVHLHVPPF